MKIVIFLLHILVADLENCSKYYNEISFTKKKKNYAYYKLHNFLKSNFLFFTLIDSFHYSVHKRIDI